MKQVTLAGVVLTALSGCASTTLQGYEGLARPDSETALVRVSGYGPSTRIVSVDSPRGDSIPIRTRTLRLLPRETCLGIEVWSVSELFELCFEPSADRTYEVRMINRPISYELAPELRSDVYTLHIRDAATREILSYVEISGIRR